MLLMFTFLAIKKKKLLEYLLYSWRVGTALSNGSGDFLTHSDDAFQHTHTIALVSSLFPINSIAVLVAVSPSFIFLLLTRLMSDSYRKPSTFRCPLSTGTAF